MQAPLPVRLIEKLIEKAPYPVLTIGLLVSLPLLLAFTLTGAIYPASDVEIWGADPLEITGLFLMFAAVPAYLLMCFTAATRHANKTVGTIASLLDAPEQQVFVHYRWSGFWPLALFLGWFYALKFNVGTGITFDMSSSGFTISVFIVFGQVFMWSVIALVLFFTIHHSLVLSQLGKRVKIDLYNMDSLNGFGRSGLLSFLMVAGALALSTLQAINQQFQWENYLNGLYVGIPAALILVPLPIWRIHRRIREEKRKLLAKIDAEVQQASPSLSDDALLRMNALLLRREQIHKLRNWPMDLSILWRFLLYVFIPPLAWIGAALMEVLLDSYLVG